LACDAAPHDDPTVVARNPGAKVPDYKPWPKITVPQDFGILIHASAEFNERQTVADKMGEDVPEMSRAIKNGP
jgi:hypothetical protein